VFTQYVRFTTHRCYSSNAFLSFLSEPVAWSKRQEIMIMTVLRMLLRLSLCLVFSHNAVAFKNDNPVSGLQYSTYLGGSGTDDCDVVATDRQGNAYLGCHSDSVKFIPEAERSFLSHFFNRQGMDAFIMRVDTSGSKFGFVRHFSGSQWEGVQGITTDDEGYIYAVGSTYSADFPVSSNAHQNRFGGKSDAFLVRLNRMGHVEWSTFFGGDGDEDGRAIALDSEGNIHIAGRTQSTNLVTTRDAIQSKNQGMTDVFVATFNREGQLLYSTYFGGSENDIGFALAVGKDDSLVVTGRTTSEDFPTKGSFYEKHRGQEDAFVFSLDKRRKSIGFSSYFGGTGHDRAQGVAIDHHNNIYILGSTESRELLLSHAGETTQTERDRDGFILKLNPTGDKVAFLTVFGGSGLEQPRSLTLDGEGHAIAIGNTTSSDFSAASSEFKGKQGNEDGFMVKINTSSSKIVKSKVWGGSGVDAFEGLAINSDGTVTVSGASNSSDFPLVDSIQQEFSGGRYDIILFNMAF